MFFVAALHKLVVSNLCHDALVFSLSLEKHSYVAAIVRQALQLVLFEVIWHSSIAIHIIQHLGAFDLPTQMSCIQALHSPKLLYLNVTRCIQWNPS